MTDEEIVLRLQQNGDKELYGILVERYEKKLSNYARKFLSQNEDIEDLIQDVFVKAYENILSFDTSRKFSSWIYRIAHNTFVNNLKKSSRNRFISFDFDILIPHPVYEDPDLSEKEEAEIRKVVDGGLQTLPPKYKEILILHYLNDQSYKEIAEILKLPVGTVGIRLKRAKEMLKKQIKNIYEYKR